MGERVCTITEHGVPCDRDHFARGLCRKHYMRWYRGYTPTEDRSRGKGHCRAKLTENDVLEIRRLWAGRELSQQELGEVFGVSTSNIGGIVRRLTWTHI